MAYPGGMAYLERNLKLLYTVIQVNNHTQQINGSLVQNSTVAAKKSVSCAIYSMLNPSPVEQTRDQGIEE